MEQFVVIKRLPSSVDQYVGGRVRLRRMMLNMSQQKFGDVLGLSFQQVQKYEKGANRITATRLQQLSQILQVPVTFFFEGAPGVPPASDAVQQVQSPAFVSEFLATSDGLALAEAFMGIKNPNLRRRLVEFVVQISGKEMPEKLDEP
jgi:transcriptional regulator with XRE-family HTH domain